MNTSSSTFLKITIWQIFFGMVAKTLLCRSYQLIINVANSQGKNLGRSVSSARTFGLTAHREWLGREQLFFSG